MIDARALFVVTVVLMALPATCLPPLYVDFFGAFVSLRLLSQLRIASHTQGDHIPAHEAEDVDDDDDGETFI